MTDRQQTDGQTASTRAYRRRRSNPLPAAAAAALGRSSHSTNTTTVSLSFNVVLYYRPVGRSVGKSSLAVALQCLVTVHPSIPSPGTALRAVEKAVAVGERTNERARARPTTGQQRGSRGLDNSSSRTGDGGGLSSSSCYYSLAIRDTAAAVAAMAAVARATEAPAARHRRCSGIDSSGGG